MHYSELFIIQSTPSQELQIVCVGRMASKCETGLETVSQGATPRVSRIYLYAERT